MSCKFGETDPGFVQQYLEECRVRGLKPTSLRLYGFFIRALDTIGVEGWEYVSSLPNGKAILKLPK